MNKKVDILLPCYNEESTIVECIKRIKSVMKKTKYKYQIVVCDNNSSDNSRKLSREQGAKVIIEKQKGYGATLLNGINKSKADYIVMLDSDLSYNEKDIPRFLEELDTCDFVMGNRFKGIIKKGAMPFSHRYGSRFLTEYANLLFHTPSHDYHCGLRAFRRKEILKCNLSTNGFEFASEMIIKAKLNKLKTKEISTDLFVDGRDSPPHLKTIRDGFRHLDLINKIAFENKIIFRYLTTFLLIIFSFLLMLYFSAIIPHKYISNNTQKSVSQLYELFKGNTTEAQPYEQFEQYGDFKNLMMIYYGDEKYPIKSMVEMNYPAVCELLGTCIYAFDSNDNVMLNYSRYWHGQTTILKPLLIFFDINFINILSIVVFSILFIITLILLFRTDKLFSIAFLLASLSINIFFVPKSIQFLIVFIIMLIGIIIIKFLYERKSKNIDLFFFIIGMVTCYYDFLTVETITLTMPLLLYLYLKNKNNDSFNYKEIIKYIILWGIGYAGTFAAKWFIDFLHYGPGIISDIMHGASIRTWNSNNIMEELKFSIINNFIPIIPFVYINNGHIILALLLLLLLSFDLFVNKKYIKILFIVLIPILRYLVLTFHSANLYFYTYRALLPVIIIGILIISSLYDYYKFSDKTK